jgi:metal-responsive CopG/Arc/MetJ family transcriptional regulator
MTNGEGSDGAATETVPIEAALSSELLREIDEFAARHGYESPDAVVAAALARRADE